MSVTQTVVEQLIVDDVPDKKTHFTLGLFKPKKTAAGAPGPNDPNPSGTILVYDSDDEFHDKKKSKHCTIF
jgi:hypothetical protein